MKWVAQKLLKLAMDLLLIYLLDILHNLVQEDLAFDHTFVGLNQEARNPLCHNHKQNIRISASGHKQFDNP